MGLPSLKITLTRPTCGVSISFHQNHPEQLVRLQDEHWNPLLTWARDTFDIELLTSDSVLFNSQPEVTKRKLDKVLQSFDPWQMAGCVFFIIFPYGHSSIGRGQQWNV
jgi:chaperone required for assembly of F1-ATPase